jgi:hypothetical protein
LIFFALFVASDRLHAMLDETTHTQERAMIDKALDLLEFIAGAGIAAGFVFLAAYAAVGGI